MTGTIETTNSNIINKIDAILRIINIFQENSITYDKKLLDDINEIKEEYEMGSVNILSEYFLILTNQKLANDENNKIELAKEKEKYFIKYQSFIRKENFISKIDRMLQHTKRYLNDNIDKNAAQFICKVIKSYNDSDIDKNIMSVTYELCQCSNKMDIESSTSRMICKGCGLTKELLGTVFEDEQFYYQEGQRVKHGSYDPSKHCRFWVERTQAKETTEIPESIITAIKHCIIRDKITNKNQLSCIQIRKYLRQTHNSKFNDHVPLIKKLITGIAPPQLTDYEIQLIHIYFDKVIHIYDEIKPSNKTNCPYHPYFIYKIIEQILDESNKSRKLKILACIHLQSQDTLIRNDIIWVPICERIPEFKYMPTDRNNQYIEF